jgi:hypothetical protein
MTLSEKQGIVIEWQFSEGEIRLMVKKMVFEVGFEVSNDFFYIELPVRSLSPFE